MTYKLLLFVTNYVMFLIVYINLKMYHQVSVVFTSAKMEDDLKEIKSIRKEEIRILGGLSLNNYL